MSSVHPALVNPDVLDEVFRHLNPMRDPRELARTGMLPLVITGALWYNDPQGPIKRKSLVNAAQVCKAFSEPASNILWQAIVDGFWPLLCSFPTFRVDCARGNITKDGSGDPTDAPQDSNDEIETFLQGISSAHWLRWEHCARRVRFLAVRDGSDSPALISSFLRIFTAARPVAASHPLPGLQTLLIDETCGDPTRVQLLHLLSLAPSLSAICIHSTRTSLEFNHLSDDLKVLSQSHLLDRLQILHASCETWHPRRRRRINDLRDVNVFRRLQVLRTDNLAPLAFDSLLPQLASLAELENLSLSLLPSNDYYGVPLLNDEEHHGTSLATPSHFGFKALRQLHVTGQPRQISKILRCVESLTLGDIALSVAPSSSADVRPMLTDLASWPAISTSLRRLHLHYDAERDWFSRRTQRAIRAGEISPLHIALSGILSPLLQLRALQFFWLSSGGRPFAIRDMDVAAMGEAWSSIRNLTVISQPLGETSGIIPQPSALRPSFSSLVHLATRCQSLEELHINSPPLDMSEDDVATLERWATADGNDLTPQPRLRRLTPAVFYDPRWLELSLPNVDRLAIVMHRLFPSLDRLQDIPEFRFYKEKTLRNNTERQAKLENSDILKLFDRIAALE
ncbi:hypothetical protein C8Q73DRAFT_699003 [Cubamyces lactineus]|nr:hypothetical protein C8Q73DRAFT_699003 [Cubamyces lactineus]